jgi:hypothetical protein
MNDLLEEEEDLNKKESSSSNFKSMIVSVLNDLNFVNGIEISEATRN